MSFICGCNTNNEQVDLFISRANKMYGILFEKHMSIHRDVFEEMYYVTCENTVNHNYCRSYKSNNCVIIFDGRLYDRKNLRDPSGELCSDAPAEQVILEWYLQEQSLEFLRNINGDFSFCIYDSKKKRILCARSPFAVRPLYYALRTNSFSFSSNLEQLVDIGALNDEVSEESLSHYIVNFLHNPSCSRFAFTPYYKTYKLISGHYLIYENGRCTTREYWQPSIRRMKNSKDELCSIFANLMFESVRDRIFDVNDVLNVDCSGGLDSSSIAYIIYNLSKKSKIPEVVLNHQIYAGDDGNESDFARYVAEQTKFTLNINHDETQKDLWLFKDFEPIHCSVLPNLGYLIRDFDQQHTSSFNNQLLATNITGCGGDHLLLGHPLFLSNNIRRLNFYKAIRSSFHYAKNAKMSPWVVFMRYALLPIFNHISYSKRIKLDLNDYLGLQYKKDLLEDIPIKKISSDPGVQDDYEQLLIDDPWGSDIGDGLQDTRHPFLDKRVVNFCFSLPGEYKDDGHSKRIIQRAAMKGIVGDRILNRTDKGSSYGSSIRGVQEEWSKLEKYFDHFYLEKLGFLKKGTIEMMLNRVRFGINIAVAETLTIISLEFWLQSFMNKHK